MQVKHYATSLQEFLRLSYRFALSSAYAIMLQPSAIHTLTTRRQCEVKHSIVSTTVRGLFLPSFHSRCAAQCSIGSLKVPLRAPSQIKLLPCVQLNKSFSYSLHCVSDEMHAEQAVKGSMSRASAPNMCDNAPAFCPCELSGPVNYLLRSKQLTRRVSLNIFRALATTIFLRQLSEIRIQRNSLDTLFTDRVLRYFFFLEYRFFFFFFQN